MDAMDVWSWTQDLTQMLRATFGERLLFVGLLAGAEDAEPDDDRGAVVIIDRFSPPDIVSCRSIAGALPRNGREFAFLSGRRELAVMPKHRLFSLSRDTGPIFGSIERVLPEITRGDILRGIKDETSELYSKAAVRFLRGTPEENEPAIRVLYKNACGLLRLLCYVQTGEYPSDKAELMNLLGAPEREILWTATEWRLFRADYLSMPDRSIGRIMQWLSGLLAMEV